MSEIKSPIAKSKFSRGERQNIVSSYDYFLLFLLALIWGSSFMMQKIAVSEVAPITMTAWRQMIAAVLFVLILLFAKILGVLRKCAV